MRNKFGRVEGVSKKCDGIKKNRSVIFVFCLFYLFFSFSSLPSRMDLIRHGGSAALRESLHYARSMKKKKPYCQQVPGVLKPTPNRSLPTTICHQKQQR
jgi:hypothetical protein